MSSPLLTLLCVFCLTILSRSFTVDAKLSSESILTWQHRERLERRSSTFSLLSTIPEKTELFGINDTLSWCYNKGLSGNGFGPSNLDRNVELSIENMSIERENTVFWCWGDGTSFSKPPGKCPDMGKPALHAKSVCPSGEEQGCKRGYDLLQWPPESDCTTPRILWVHGGSWMMDSPWDEHYFVHTSKVAKHTSSLVLSIDYPLIGGWKHGTKEYAGSFAGVQEYALGAWAWLASHGPHGQKCDGERPPAMFIAGDSSGGGTAMSLLLELNEMKKGNRGSYTMPSGAFFESPWLNLKSDSATYESNSAVFLPNKSQAAKNPSSSFISGDLFFNDLGKKGTFADASKLSLEYAKNGLSYCGNCPTSYRGPLPERCEQGTCGDDKSTQAQLSYWKASPFFADAEKLRDLPPLHFSTSATELLTADTTSFAAKAASVGVSVTGDLFEGMWHTFPQWSEGCRSPFGDLWQGKAALVNQGSFVEQVASAFKRCPESFHQPLGTNLRSHAIMLHKTTDEQLVARPSLNLCANKQVTRVDAKNHIFLEKLHHVED